MRNFLCTVVVTAIFSTSSAILAADPPQQEKPIREIFVPFEDLDVLLDGDAHRVFLDRADYEELIAKAKTSLEKEKPHAWLTLAADYQVTIEESRATIQAVIDIEVFSKGLFAVPLTLNGVGIRSAMLDDDVAPLGRAGNGQVNVFIAGQGKHRVRLDLVTRLQTTAAQQSLKFELPLPPSRRMRLMVPGNVEVRNGAAVSSRVVDAEANVTRFELVPPPGPIDLTMSLNNRTLLQQRVVMARSVMVAEVTQAYERLHATVSLGVLHGAVERFRFRIPLGFEVSNVSSLLLSRWVVTPPTTEGDASILEVILREPTTDVVVLNLSATATSTRFDAWSMPRFEPQDVNNHVAVVGLLVEDRLAVEAITVDGLIPIDNAVLRKGLPPSVFNAEPGAPQVRTVVVYYAPQSVFELSARFTRPPARTNVTSHAILLLEETKKSILGGFTLEPEAEKVFAVDLLVPADWTITAIESQNKAPLPHENFLLPNGDTRMRVRLPHGVPLGEHFDLHFDATSTPTGWLGDWSAREVEFPVFKVLGAARDSGAIAVKTLDDLVARPLQIDGLVPLDKAQRAAMLQEEEKPDNILAYQYFAQPYTATFQMERGQPRLTARTFSFLKIEPDGLTAHYEIVFDVRHARAKQLTFSLPADTPTALMVRTDDDPRKDLVKEYNSEVVRGQRQWTVLLTEPQTGPDVRLEIGFSQPLSGDEPQEWDLPIIEARDVAYQTAMVAVEGNSEFDIKLTTEGRKIDVGELVDADYQVGRRLLGAYGFVGTVPQVSVDVFRRDGYGLPAAIVQRVEFVTLVSRSGRSLTVGRYQLHTKATYLQIDLPDPEHTQLWSVIVDGVPGTPQRDGDSLLISLPPKTNQGIRNLQLAYESSFEEFEFMGNIKVVAPRLVIRGDDELGYEVPVADLTWDLVLPDGHRILRTGGSVFRTTKPSRKYPWTNVADFIWRYSGSESKSSFADAQVAMDIGPVSAERASPAAAIEMYEEEMESAGEDGASMDFGPPASNDELTQNQPDSEAPDTTVESPQGQAVEGQLWQTPEQVDAPVRVEFWALQGFGSLQIELHQGPDRVGSNGETYRIRRMSFRSMGASPVLQATLVDGHRLDFLYYGLALLVVVIGVGLTCESTKLKVRYLVVVVLIALVLPLVFGWISDLDLGTLFDGAFYAACVLAFYYVLVHHVLLIGCVLRSLRRPRRRSPVSDNTGNSPGAATSTVVSLLVFLAIVPNAFAQPALPSATHLTPAGLADLLRPTPPVKLPADAVIIPYDADAVDGLDKAERVLVPFDEYTRLWNRAYPDQPINRRAPPADFAFAGGQYSTVLEDDDQLTINGHIDIDVFVDEPVSIPLPLQRAVLARATLDGETARIQVVTAIPPTANAPAQAKQQRAAPTETFIVVHAQGKGRHRLDISVRLRLERSGGWRVVDGVIPVTPSTRLELTIPLAETEVRLSGVADRDVHETERDGEQFSTALDDRGIMQLRWRPKVGAGDVDQSLTVSSSAIFDIQEDGLRMAWQLNLTFRTQRETFTLQLPTDYLVEKVTGDNVQGWTRKLLEDAQQLDVTLLKATTGSEKMMLFFSRRQTVGQGELTEFDVPVVSVPDAVLHQGHFVIRRSPLLKIETLSRVGVSQTDATEESRALIGHVQKESPFGIRPYQNYHFVTTPYSVTLSARPAGDPKTTPVYEQAKAALQTLLRVGARETSYECKITIEDKQRPVHRVRALLPLGFDLDKVDAPGLYERSTTTEAGRQLLTVYLAEGQGVAFSVLISGHVTRTADAADVALPNIEILDVGEQHGHIVLQADPAYRVTLSNLTNCKTFQLPEDVPWLNSDQRSYASELAVSYDSRDYAATLKTALVTPNVTSSTISNVLVTRREIEETVSLHFNIVDAGIREVVFRLPARMRDAQFYVPMLRQTTIQDVAGDPTSIQVTMELQDDTMGELIVRVENRVPLSGTQHEVPIPVVETGQSQKRYVLLENAGRDEVVVAETVGMETLRRNQDKWTELTNLLNNRTQGFVITSDVQPKLAFATKRRDVVATAGAAIRLAEATIVVDGSGTYRAVQEYRVDNETEQYLEIELPTGALLWTVRVAGEPVKPTVVTTAGGRIDDRLLRIPLIKTDAGGSDYSVEIKYGGQLGKFSAFRSVAFPLVKTKRIKVELSHVRLHLPDTHQFFRFDGTMTRVHEEDEGDMGAETLGYFNSMTAKFTQMANASSDGYSSKRAQQSLEVYKQKALDYIDANKGFATNRKFQSALRSNERLQSEAVRQMKSQKMEREAQVTESNRDQLRRSFTEQKNSRSSNVVNSLGSNFFGKAPNVEPPSNTNNGKFNEQLLGANEGPQQEQQAKQLERIDGGGQQGLSGKPSVPGTRQQLFRYYGKDGQQPDYFSRSAQPDSGRESSKDQRSGESGDGDGEGGEAGSAAVGGGAGGFGGGKGGDEGRFAAPGRRASRSENRPSMDGPVATGASVISQTQEGEAALADRGEMTFVAGLASLDFDLPVRGNKYLFTTARGDTQISVQAVSSKQLRRWEHFGSMLFGFVAFGIFGLLTVRINAMLGRRIRATLLIVTGICSLVTFILPLIGLLLIIWGIVSLVFAQFVVNESAPTV